MFKIYIYKTCFVLNNSFDDQDRWLFQFYYARPTPILLGGRNTNSYRFQMIAAATPKKRVFYSGAIETIAP